MTSLEGASILEHIMNKPAETATFQALVAAFRRPSFEARPENRLRLGIEDVDARLGGLPRGALHEIFAGTDGHAGAAIGFAAVLARLVCAKRSLLWVRQDFAALEYGEIAASGLLELGLDPHRLILVRAADALGVLRVAADALACGGLGAVVAEIPGNPKILDLTASRRLVFAAARKNVTALLLRLNATPTPSAAETRWMVRAARSDSADDDWGRPRFDVTLARHRHGATGQWLMEWSCDDGHFIKPGNRLAAHSGAVAATPAHRPPSSPGIVRRTA